MSVVGLPLWIEVRLGPTSSLIKSSGFTPVHPSKCLGVILKEDRAAPITKLPLNII